MFKIYFKDDQNTLHKIYLKDVFPFCQCCGFGHFLSWFGSEFSGPFCDLIEPNPNPYWIRPKIERKYHFFFKQKNSVIIIILQSSKQWFVLFFRSLLFLKVISFRIMLIMRIQLDPDPQHCFLHLFLAPNVYWSIG